MNPTIQQYNDLSMHYRVLLLEQESTFIGYFLTLETTTTLYFFNKYYVELTVDNETNDLMDVAALSDPAALDKYLEDLVLDELMPTKK
jgi:hypothetical protein